MPRRSAVGMSCRTKWITTRAARRWAGDGQRCGASRCSRSDEPPYERTAETAKRDSEGGITDGCAKGNSKDNSDDQSQNNVETKQRRAAALEGHRHLAIADAFRVDSLVLSIKLGEKDAICQLDQPTPIRPDGPHRRPALRTSIM
jgi:hypothetical protein